MRILIITGIMLGQLLAAGVAQAASVQQATFHEMARASELVLDATAGPSRVEQPGSPDTIRTCVRFTVGEVLAGRFDQPEIDLCWIGGTYGDIRLDAGNSPPPKPGTRLVLFVEKTGIQMINPLYGWDQGLMRVGLADGQAHLLTARGEPILSLDPSANPRIALDGKKGQEGVTDLFPGHAKGVVPANMAGQGYDGHMAALRKAVTIEELKAAITAARLSGESRQ